MAGKVDVSILAPPLRFVQLCLCHAYGIHGPRILPPTCLEFVAVGLLTAKMKVIIVGQRERIMQHWPVAAVRHPPWNLRGHQQRRIDSVRFAALHCNHSEKVFSVGARRPAVARCLAQGRISGCSASFRRLRENIVASSFTCLKRKSLQLGTPIQSSGIETKVCIDANCHTSEVDSRVGPSRSSLLREAVFTTKFRSTFPASSPRGKMGSGAEMLVANPRQMMNEPHGGSGDTCPPREEAVVARQSYTPFTSSAADVQVPSGGIGRRMVAMLLAGSMISTNFGCKCCEDARAQDWSYGGPSGPAQWQGICTNGPKQSPINITSNLAGGGESQGVLEFVYSTSSPSILNNGHGTMQVSFGKAKNVLKAGGKILQLLQFHFHAPSEHAFDGERYAMEAHLVHCDMMTKELTVIGVMLDASEDAVPNKCVAASLAYAPREHGVSVDVPIQLSPSFLIPPTVGKEGYRGYVHYRGSLTTPPCSEGVEWFVLDTPLKISSSQVLDFMRFVGDGHSLAFNSRPLQLLGDRPVFRGP